MLEAKLGEAGTLKKLLEAIKELVTDANFECNEEGIVLQAMDNSHVALVAVRFTAPSFKRYRCDRPMPLGINLVTLTKIMRCAKDDDECTLKAADEADVLNLVYEAKNTDRIAEYDMKLMDIDADTLAIPDTEYEARVTMTSSEFSRIVKDLSQLGESVRIEVSKEGVRFASDGEAANGSVLLKQIDGGHISGGTIKPKGDDPTEGEADDDDNEEGSSVKKEKKDKVKNENNGQTDVEMDGEDKEKEKDDDEDVEEEHKAKENGEEDGEDEQDEDDEDDEEGGSKKRKKKAKAAAKPVKKAKTSSRKGKSKDDEEEYTGVKIEMNSHVSLTFSLKYLVNFSKSSGLSTTVQLMMSNDVPLLVAYEFPQGYIRYYLAPKIGDD